MKSPSFVLPCTPEYRHRGLLRRTRRERISLGSLTKVRVREKAHYRVAEFHASQTDLFNSADAALYEAKSAGKNCVVAACGKTPK